MILEIWDILTMAHSDWYDLYDTVFSVYRLPTNYTESEYSGVSNPIPYKYTDVLGSLQPMSDKLRDRLAIAYDRINVVFLYRLFCDVQDYPDPIETDIIEISTNSNRKLYKIINIANEVNKNEVLALDLELHPENTISL